MEGIQAGADLHALHLLHRIPGRKHDACLFQPRAPIGERVLNHQVFCFLRIDKGCHIGVLACYNALCIREACILQHFPDTVIRTRGDFVYHAPREGHAGRILNIFKESPGRLSIIRPGFCIGSHCGGQFIAIVGAVIHAYQGQRRCSMGISPVAQGYQFSDIAVRHIRTSFKIPCHIRTERAVRGCDAVSFLRDGEAGHLKGAACKNSVQAVPVSLILTVHGQ